MMKPEFKQALDWLNGEKFSNHQVRSIHEVPDLFKPIVKLILLGFAQDWVLDRIDPESGLANFEGCVTALNGDVLIKTDPDWNFDRVLDKFFENLRGHVTPMYQLGFVYDEQTGQWSYNREMANPKYQ